MNKPRNGFLLITALLLITGLTTLLTANLTQTLANKLAVDQSAATTRGYFAAEAGIDYALRVLVADFLDSTWDTCGAITQATPIPGSATPAPGPLPSPAGSTASTGDGFSVTVTKISPGLCATGTSTSAVSSGDLFQLQAVGSDPTLQVPKNVVVVFRALNPWPYPIYGSGLGPLLANGGQTLHQITNADIRDISGGPTVIADATQTLDFTNPGFDPTNLPHLFAIGASTTLMGPVLIGEPLYTLASLPGYPNALDQLVEMQPGATVTPPPGSPAVSSLGPPVSLPPVTPGPSPTPGWGDFCADPNPNNWPDLIVGSSGLIIASPGGGTLFSSPQTTNIPIPANTGSPPIPTRIMCFRNVTIGDNGTLEFDHQVAMYVNQLTITNGGRFLATNLDNFSVEPPGGGGAPPPTPSNLLVLAVDNPAVPTALSVQGGGSAFKGLWYSPTRDAQLGTDAPGANPDPNVYFTGAMVVRQLRAGSVGGSQVIVRKTPVQAGLFLFTILGYWLTN